MPRIGIALGSNLGDRLANLHAACELLREIATPGAPFLRAPIYQTEPRHCPPGSPDFYNTVVEISYDGDPATLLEATQAIERKMGRVDSPERNAPRIMDVDLLYFGDTLLDTGSLVLPHVRLGERRFVLQPLAVIRPSLILPGANRTISEMLAELVSDEPPLTVVENPQAELGDLKMLAAEDHFISQKILDLLLRRLGIQATWVTNGAEAVHEAERGDFDVILLDLQMPVMDGLEASRKIRALRTGGKRPHIFAISAGSSAANVEAAREAGMDGYLDKATPLEDLRQALLPLTKKA